MPEDINKKIDAGTLRAIQIRYELMRKVKDLELLVEQYKNELRALKNKALLLDTNFDKILDSKKRIE